MLQGEPARIGSVVQVLQVAEDAGGHGRKEGRKVETGLLEALGGKWEETELRVEGYGWIVDEYHVMIARLSPTLQLVDVQVCRK